MGCYYAVGDDEEDGEGGLDGAEEGGKDLVWHYEGREGALGQRLVGIVVEKGYYLNIAIPFTKR